MIAELQAKLAAKQSDLASSMGKAPVRVRICIALRVFQYSRDNLVWQHMGSTTDC
jgi:hypothetical protein